MTVKLIALWTSPVDREGFLSDYAATHAVLAREVPGLLAFEASTSVDGAYLRVAQLTFEDMEGLGAAMSSAQGIALAADSERLASTFGNSLEVLIVEVEHD